MEVLTRCEGNCLEFFLKGELDHHGAQGLLLRLEQDIQKALPMALLQLRSTEEPLRSNTFGRWPGPEVFLRVLLQANTA